MRAAVSWAASRAPARLSHSSSATYEQSLKFAALGGQERRLGGILAKGGGIRERLVDA